jgi:VWFA-related protein
MPLGSAQSVETLCVPKVPRSASGASDPKVCNHQLGDRMNRTLAHALLGLALATMFSVAGISLALAQAPTGPAPGGQPQQTPPPGQNPPQQQPKPQEGGLSIAVEVPVVTMDVVATTQRGDIITGLKRENFTLFEDGVPQTITNFGPSDAPITMVVLMEFSARYGGWYSYVAKYWTEALFPNLRKDDWVALVTFDMKPKLEVDFTQNKDEVRQAVYHLYFPGFSESNVFDAILDTTERLKDVKGKKCILLIATGRDTFSKHTYDQTMKALRQSDVPLFIVGMSKAIQNNREMRFPMASSIDLLQDENEMKTFAKLTGGFAWFPQFTGEIPGIFQDVAAYLRNQYSLSYSPTNRARDGKFRKVKIDLVAPDGSPFTVTDQKGKKQKYQVYAREGYSAPKGDVD